MSSRVLVLLASMTLRMVPTENVAGLTSYTWTIGTAKNLSESNVFFFEIFISGQPSPSAISHYFNLTKAAGPETSTTTSGSSVASTTSIFPTNNATSSTATTTSATSSPKAAATSSGLSTGAKAGIGVGIPLAVMVGSLVGFLLFRHYGRGRKDDNAPPPASAVPYMLAPAIHEPKGMSMGPQWPVASTVSSSDIRRDETTSPVEMPADHQI